MLIGQNQLYFKSDPICLNGHSTQVLVHGLKSYRIT